MGAPRGGPIVQPEVAVVIVYAIAAAAVLLVALVVLAMRRTPRFDEVEAFHRARQLTSQWSAESAPAGVAVSGMKRETA